VNNVNNVLTSNDAKSLKKSFCRHSGPACRGVALAKTGSGNPDPEVFPEFFENPDAVIGNSGIQLFQVVIDSRRSLFMELIWGGNETLSYSRTVLAPFAGMTI
jgi:hypothetical protein